jgi:UDP-glucuronate decarboxylase
MKKILVTGGAGFIGSHLAQRLAKDENNYVVIADNLLTGKLANLTFSTRSNWRFIKADVNRSDDLSSIMLSYQFDEVFHFAAVVGVQRTLQNPVNVLSDIEGIRLLFNLSKNTGVKCVYYASSSEVYGEPVEFPQNEETTPLNSRLPYAVVKNVGEAFLKSYLREYGLNYFIFRFFNIFGPGQSCDFVISKFLDAALKNLPVEINGSGLQTRTFCFIDDAIEVIARVKDLGLLNDVVNVGNDQELAVIDVAKMIIDLTQSGSAIVHQPALKEGDMTRRKPDISKMKKLLNRDPLSFEGGLVKLLNHRMKSFSMEPQMSTGLS